MYGPLNTDLDFGYVLQARYQGLRDLSQVRLDYRSGLLTCIVSTLGRS
jgi:hypothetical protein